MKSCILIGSNTGVGRRGGKGGTPCFANPTSPPKENRTAVCAAVEEERPFSSASFVSTSAHEWIFFIAVASHLTPVPREICGGGRGMAYDALAGDASETAHRRTVVVVAFTAADDVWIDALVPLYSLPLSLFSPRRPPLVLWSICSGLLLLLFRICPYGPSSSDASQVLSSPSSSFRKKLLS